MSFSVSPDAHETNTSRYSETGRQKQPNNTASPVLEKLNYTFKYPRRHQGLNASFKVITITVLPGKDHQVNPTLINTSGTSEACHTDLSPVTEKRLCMARLQRPVEGHS